MERATQIVFRKLTPTDFYNLYKPQDSEELGGGQTYIDFPTTSVTERDWGILLKGQTIDPSRPFWWRAAVWSIGVGRSQTVDIGKRRERTISIRNQTLDRRSSNRLYAWLPRETGFPEPIDPRVRETVPGLTVFLLRSTSGSIWAGWFITGQVRSAAVVHPELGKLITEDSGVIYPSSPLPFDEEANNWPFGLALDHGASFDLPLLDSTLHRPRQSSKSLQPIEDVDRVDSNFLEDLESLGSITPERQERIVSTYKRDARLVSALKDLYGGKCQLSGTQLTFRKKNGVYYSEAHHLNALGSGGSDSPLNLIIVSPLIHRMFHYADVTPMNLASIRNYKLPIRINGDRYTITWHPKHMPFVQELRKSARSS